MKKKQISPFYTLAHQGKKLQQQITSMWQRLVHLDPPSLLLKVPVGSFLPNAAMED